MTPIKQPNPMHNDSKKAQEQCHHFLKDKCKKGPNCLFLHNEEWKAQANLKKKQKEMEESKTETEKKEETKEETPTTNQKSFLNIDFFRQQVDRVYGDFKRI